MKSIYLALACALLLGGAFAQSVPQTPNLHLNEPPYRYQRWDIPNNANWTLLDSFWGSILSGCGGDGSHGIGWDPVLHFQCVGIVGTNAPGGSPNQLQYNNAGGLGGFNDGTAHQVLHGLRTFSAVTGLDTDSTIAQTGADINTSFQVTSLHLSAPCSIAMGCTGTATPGLIQGTNITISGTWPNQTITSLAGGPGGAPNQVEFNDSGTHGGNAALTFNKTTGTTTAKYVATSQGPMIDPFAYGADNTGSADATSFWNTAKAQMETSKGTIICAGSYKLDRILLAGNDFIQGTGPTNERGCNITPKTDAAFVTSATTFAGSIYLSDITFHGGSNPIDFPLVNDVYFTRLNLDEPTGCGIVMAAAERYHIYDVTGSWNSATGFATLCTGDPSKSIFSATIPGGSPIGSSLPTVYGLSNLTNGPNKSGSAHTQWLWWEGTSMDGASIHQLYCSFGCESGIWSVGSLVPAQVVMENTVAEGIQLDNIGLVATPAAKAINIAGKMFYSSIRDYNPCWNTNHIAIDLYIEAFQGADIKNYCGTAGVNNTTTFGIVVGSHGGAVGQITSSQGGLFSSGANEQNEISIIGSDMTPNNFAAGAIINERENKGVQVTLDAAGGNTGVATSSWTVKRSAGSGNYTTDISSNGPAGTGFIANEDVSMADGIFGSNQKNGRSACETTFGTTSLIGGSATIDTGLNCAPANSVIDAIVYRITQTGNGFTSFTIGDATTAGRFCGTQSTVTSGTTGVCFVQSDQTGAAGPRQASAAKVRVATNAGGAIIAGAIRLIVYYHTWTPPTS